MCWKNQKNSRKILKIIKKFPRYLKYKKIGFFVSLHKQHKTFNCRKIPNGSRNFLKNAEKFQIWLVSPENSK